MVIKKIIGMALLFLASSYWLSLTCNAETQNAEATSLVEVLIVKTSPDIYEVSIANRYKSSISMVILGNSTKPEWAISAQIPSVIKVPDGWQGDLVFQENQDFMHIYLMSKSSTSFIPSNGVLSGIKIKIPKFKPEWKGTFRDDGLEVRPLDVGTLPFSVIFEDGRNEWGKVKTSVSGRMTKNKSNPILDKNIEKELPLTDEESNGSDSIDLK